MNTDTGYELKHPEYLAMRPVYERNEALYDGGSSVDGEAAARRFLVQHHFEKDEQFNIRIKRAAYRNYAAPTVDLFASSIMDGVQRPGLEGMAGLAPLLTNCDRRGLSPDVFFKSVNASAAAVGAHFVLVDQPRAREGLITRADASREGIMPYFVRVPALNVFSWDFGEDDALEWATVYGEEWRATGPFEAYEKIQIVTVWDRYSWRRFESRDGSAYEAAGAGQTGLGLVPLVPFLYEPQSPMTGRSVIDDVARLILRVFNQDSELDKMLFDAALPLLAVFGLKPEDEEGMKKATSALWRFSNPTTRLEYIEPTGASFAAKRQQILDDVESIREISLRQTKPRGAQVESAEAKRLDSVQISSQLADFARNAAASERRCWEIAGRMAGADESAMEGIKIEYNETFDPDSLREQLTARFMELRQNGDYSRESILRRLGLTDAEIEEENARIAAEKEQDARGLVGPAGTGGIGSAVAAILRTSSQERQQ